MINKGLFSSDKDNWETPELLYQYLDSLYSFDHDPCPIDHYVLLGMDIEAGASYDSLNKPWGKSNYINPPYGRQIGKFIEKAYKESLLGKICVLLIPARTDTKWWHDFVMLAATVYLVRGRIRFKDGEHSAPFPSAIVVFDEKSNGQCLFKSFNYKEKVLGL
jgi:hypothetical protein